MSVTAVLTPERIFVAGDGATRVHDKAGALVQLSQLFASASAGRKPGRSPAPDEILRVLVERERQQSTGVGGGVAIPHGAMGNLDAQLGALLVIRPAIDFDAVDGVPVSIVFGLLGPRGAPAAHLKLLARVARLLRDEDARGRIAQVRTGAEAFTLVSELDRRNERA